MIYIYIYWVNFIDDDNSLEKGYYIPWKEYYRHFEFHYRRNSFVQLDNYYLEMQNICDTLTCTILCNCSQIFAENEQCNAWMLDMTRENSIGFKRNGSHTNLYA